MNELCLTDAVILCGGLGTRLKSILQDRPKPMADIHDRPFLDILIGHLASFGIKRFVLCTGYKSDFIADYYQKRNDGLTYVISPEQEPLGTAGAIKNAERLIKSNVFLAFNGDSFCKADLGKFFTFHQSRDKAILSIILTNVKDVGDYGSITLGNDQEIIRFNEKHSAQGPGYVNAGIYAFNRTILERIPPTQNLSLEYNLFPSLVSQGLYGYVTENELFDIGTPERLEIAKKNL